ncbi:MAG: hypothetical protein OEV07_13305, partial [Gammaproteobacteria bacterium]|nr:hypothetical protein [Gammaproteobacteria bacterium]
MKEAIERVRRAAQYDLPDLNRLRQQAVDLATQITVGRSAFLDEYGVQYELEYKLQAMRDNHVMYHAHIGMNDIDATVQALTRIHEELSLKGYRLDRAGFAIDRRMGLPPG